ncbi:sugar kinase [Vibrio hannami]|uniref:sugar kinase n=1 Tax=Vibrio hannami TaxID=2717094 RepID=UPI00240ED5D6|nr:sugar kinase [Vibrio hannami]MDG3086329.1 sugar kinase [Vibrio hannami]
MRPFKIALLGECMVELQQHGEYLKQAFGGDTLNTAMYLSRLTKGLGQTSYVTALGNDPFSQGMVREWNENGIDTSLIMHIDEKQPGLYYIETDDTGERKFHYWRNDSAAKYIFDQAERSVELINNLMEFDAIYVSGITIAILTDTGRNVLFSLLEKFRAKGGLVCFDNNYRPKLWASQEQAIKTYKTMLSLTDIAMLTFDDEQDVYGDTKVEECIDRTQSAGVKEIVIKRGAEDCLIVVADEQISVPATKVENVVDTTAAGDSFSGGYLAKRLTEGSAVDSAKLAHQMAGTVIQHKGAVIPLDAMANLTL